MPGIFKTEEERQNWHLEMSQAKSEIREHINSHSIDDARKKMYALAAFDVAIETIKQLPLPPKIDIVVDSAADLIHKIVHEFLD